MKYFYIIIWGYLKSSMSEHRLLILKNFSLELYKCQKVMTIVEGYSFFT